MALTNQEGEAHPRARSDPLQTSPVPGLTRRTCPARRGVKGPDRAATARRAALDAVASWANLTKAGGGGTPQEAAQGRTALLPPKPTARPEGPQRVAPRQWLRSTPSVTSLNSRSGATTRTASLSLTVHSAARGCPISQRRASAACPPRTPRSRDRPGLEPGGDGLDQVPQSRKGALLSLNRWTLRKDPGSQPRACGSTSSNLGLTG